MGGHSCGERIILIRKEGKRLAKVDFPIAEVSDTLPALSATLKRGPCSMAPAESLDPQAGRQRAARIASVPIPEAGYARPPRR